MLISIYISFGNSNASQSSIHIPVSRNYIELGWTG